MMNQRNSFIIQGLVWLLLLLIFFLVTPHPAAELIILGYGFLNIALFYFSYFFVTPVILNRRNYYRGFSRLLIIVIVSIAIKYGIALTFESDVMYYGENFNTRYTDSQYLWSAGLVSLFFVLLSFCLRLTYNFFNQEREKRMLENEKLTAELSFLKSQINPHFLFNSLNNIYSLTYHKSDRAPEAILKLSGIMRYMLQESDDDKVQLKDEIAYLDNYVSLQQLRFKEALAIDYKVNIESLELKIMPLLLISFLENAFKHGVVTNKEHPVRILVEVVNNRLHFVVSNFKNKSHKDQTSGIGLENLKRRLELGYPNRYTLMVDDKELFYSSELFIYL